MSRVLVITNNLQQASFRLRIETLIPQLTALGHEIVVRVRPRGLLARRALLREASAFDAVILQRKLLDPSDARLLRRHAKKLFFDVDDAVMFHNAPTGFISRWRTQRRFVATARSVDVVVAGNCYLENIFAEQGAKHTHIPTVVDVSRYTVKIHTPTPSPRLVWIGSKSTLPYLDMIAPALSEAHRKVPSLSLLIIADESWPKAPLPIQFMPWTEPSEAAALLTGDIGIAPTPTDPWTLGKCGFKIIQYMAAGLPVVASPVGANAEIVLPDATGFLPTTNEDWANTITQLAVDAELRERLGASGRARAIEHYSLKRAIRAWHLLLT